jgi:transcriptional regulator with GAF, ATPase, and Fis domain
MNDGLADLLACVAAFGQSLQATFDPRLFLDDLSARAQRLVPHHRMLVPYLEDDEGTATVFAEHTADGVLFHEGRYTTDFDPAGRYGPGDWALGPLLLTADVVLSGDVANDPRFRETEERTRLVAAGIRSALGVPLHAGGKTIGALGVSHSTPDAYSDRHVAALRQIADLIAPFVQNVVTLHRERRRRERLQAIAALAPILGASLDVGELFERIANAVRPVLDFDAMGIRTARENGRDFQLVGLLAPDVATWPAEMAAEEFSFWPALARGDAVVIRHQDLDPRRPGDRRIGGLGFQSGLFAPLVSGRGLDGYLFFSKRPPHWYDGADAEVAKALAAEVIVAVQHQRLVEERQRLAAVEAKAQRLEEHVETLRGVLEARFGFDAVIGRAPSFLAALDQAKRVAPTETTVLITGESGTGKEVVAHAIHYASARAEKPFVAVNCAALPETLVESELFGHERGAFTGADKLKRGRFEIAGGGTLFLDEIGELTPAVQAKLLRVLQERQYERVGGTATFTADVRLITATNRDLERDVADRRFREDLYYRLAVFRIHLPPLRERGDDVILLARHFIRALGAKMGKAEAGLSRDAHERLVAHGWPGNIRELQNAIERALILTDGSSISAEQLALPAPRPRAPEGVAPPAPTSGAAAPAPMPSLAEIEKQSIVEALSRANGNKSRAAQMLGLSRMQLYTRLRRFGLAD